jgi:hypothetical protein
MNVINEDSNDEVSTVAAIKPVEFQWGETDATVGVIAQEIGSIDLSDYSITTGIGLSNDSISFGNSNWVSGSNISFTNSNGFHADTTEYGKNTIKTAKSIIDIDELAEMMETLKKRLLILTPDFEKHEKYPMLKELYNEYKAMEALLSGPDDIE